MKKKMFQRIRETSSSRNWTHDQTRNRRQTIAVFEKMITELKRQRGNENVAILRTVSCAPVMAITKMSIGVPPVNLFTVAVRCPAPVWPQQR
jgi:hypothetical protein